MTAPTHKDLLARALVELRTLRQKLADAGRARHEPIAVVGLGCRFPGGCDDPDALWRFLCAGGDATGDLPPGRWREATGPDPAGMYTRRGAYLKNQEIEGFDARFFGVTERELHSLDPQHRLMLEVCWEALEHAAIAPERLRRSRTGVFCGVSVSDWAHLLGEHVELADLDGYFGPGTALSFAPGRVAYFLGLQGPSLAVDTACSSSLVAVHLACQSLRAGESDLALAAGVSLILSRAGHAVLCKARVLSPEGRCKTFDAGADGYARGEGCGVVVLKRLTDALADGDRVLAVVRGSAVNQDGPSSGMTVPNPAAQEAVVRDALAAAGVHPREVDYVEAHGTATPLGDPIEVRALAAALAADRPADRPLLLGTIKTNLGHLEAAAGIAGFIKLVLALHHGQIPQNLHLRRPNPAVAWDRLPVAVVDAHRPWPAGPRIAGVSSFGASGTNAHAILAAHQPVPGDMSSIPAPKDMSSIPAPKDSPPVPGDSSAQILVLTAASEPALRALAGRHARHLDAHPDAPLAAHCATAALGRARLAHVLTTVASDVPGLAARLAAIAAAPPGAAPEPPSALGARPLAPPRVAFVFSGQGTQRPGLADLLRADLPAFRAALATCDDLLRPELGRSVLDLLADPADLAETRWAQPALFAVGWALAAQWRAWGVEPAAVLGHSLGGYLAACLAGVLRLADAAPLVARRAQLMQSLPRGAMLAVAAPAADLADVVAARPDALAIAAINGPTDTVLSGSLAAIDDVAAALAARGVRTRRLPVSHAFHSPLMDPALDALEREVARVPLAAPTLPLISDLTGAVAGDEVTRPAYHRRHMREPVRFADALTAARGLGCTAMLEVGPGASLCALAARVVPGLRALPSLRRGPPRADMLATLGELAVLGVDVAWPTVHAGTPHNLALPTYPFQRRPHWFREPAVDDASDPLLGHRRPDRDAAVFVAELRPGGLPVLRDHRVYGRIVVSGAVHAAMALRAARLLGRARLDLEDLEFLAPLIVPEGGAVNVETRLIAAGAAHRFELTRSDEPGPLTRGVLRPRPDEVTPPAPLDLAAIRARCRAELSGDELYARFWRPDEHELGPSYRTIDHVWRRDGEALARLRPPAIDLDGHGLAPDDLLAICVAEVYGQILMPAVPDFAAVVAALEHTFLGSSIRRSRDHGGVSRATHAHAVVHHFDGEELRGDVRLLAADGSVLVEISDLRARKVPRSLVRHAMARDGRPRQASVRAAVLDGPPDQLPARARRFVHAQVAALVGGADDFADDASLQTLGVDSLMALDFHDALRRGLDVDLPLATTMQGATLHELVTHLVAALRHDAPALPAPPPASPWLYPLATSPRATTRVIAFPHGGGGPAGFLPWRGLVPDALAVDVVQLPGRWERMHEPPHLRLGPLVDALLAALRPTLTPPFVFFGVSMGALVAYELTRALQRAGAPLPQQLFVAAYPAPDLQNPLHAHRDALRQALGDPPDPPALARHGLLPAGLRDPEALRMVLPPLRADLEVVLHHEHRPGPPLPLPIHALGGRGDPLVTREHLAGWIRHTAADFGLHMLPGGHLFYRTDPEPTLRALAARMTPP